MPTPLEVISYDGYDFASNDWYGGQPYDSSRGQWAINQNVAQRTGNTPVVSPGAISPRRIAVDFTLEPNSTLGVLEAIDELIGSLNPLDQTARTLIANRNGVTVQREARIEIPNGFSSSGAVNVVQVVFVSESPEWTEETPVTEDQTGSPSPDAQFSLEVINAGTAPVHPVYQIRWITQRVSKSTVYGQEYRKLLVLTNTQARTIPPFPYRVNLGNTAALVSGSKAQADGDDLRIIVGGRDTTRKLIGWNLTQSWCWVVIPGMDALGELQIEIVYGNASATNPPVWTDPDPTKPVIDMDWETGTATGGSTTTVVKAGAGWAVDKWDRGYVTMLTGLNAGVTREITDSTADTLTTSAFSNSNANGDTFLIAMSRNERWNYAVRQTDREAEYARGRWYLDSPMYTPNDVSFDSPGSWRPELIMENRDSMGAKRFSMIDTGSGDKDPFAILDAQRMWEGNDGNVYNPGTADGAAISVPVPIRWIYWQYQFDNPNGMCKTWIGVRGSGSEDWAAIMEDDAITTGLTTLGAGGGSTTFLDVATSFGSVYQIAMALLPQNDIEIDLTWRRDTGSLTSATTTVSTDSSKEWETDQYDNGSILMLSGVNKGIKRSITSGTSTAQTHAAFPAASADGDRYVVQNKRLKGRLLDGAMLALELDATMIDADYGSEEAVYEFAGSIWVGNGPGGASSGQHRSYFGSFQSSPTDAENLRLFLGADEVIEVDSARRRVRILNTVSDEYVRTLTDPMVVVQYCPVFTEEFVRSADWLPLGVGSQTVWLQDNSMGEMGISVTYYPAYLA